MSEHFGPCAVTKRVLFSAFFGIFITTGLVLPAMEEAARYLRTGGAGGFRRDSGELIGQGADLFLLALLITAPLVVVSVAVALLFRSSIEKHPARWCIAAPIIIWVFASFMLAPDSGVGGGGPSRHSMWTVLSDPGTLLFLYGPVPSSIIFYWLCWRKKRAVVP